LGGKLQLRAQCVQISLICIPYFDAENLAVKVREFVVLELATLASVCTYVTIALK